MHQQLPIATILLIAATCIVSLRAFRDRSLQDKLIFCPELILARKEYYRVVTSAFLHADSRHLIFNMLTLYLFGRNLETVMGIERFLIVYLASVIGGSLLSLYLHRNHEYYALGASGGVCGIVFASIFLFPGGDIFMMFIPVGIPSWLYAILFLLSEFVGVRTQRTNIGHEGVGWVCGIVFASIFLFPGGDIFLMFIPVGMLTPYSKRFRPRDSTASAKRNAASSRTPRKGDRFHFIGE